LAFLGSSDHALKERTVIEINVKIAAAYHRKGQAVDAARHFDRAFRMFDGLVAKGADDPYTRYYIAQAHALTGNLDAAFDSLERVAVRLPALTAARMRRDTDLGTLKDDPRFHAILNHAT
jgi:tetratricopeptide (TPR) repeat protein